jgi:hypothetical protein
MPITQVGAIYATRSKLLQRIYIPHADDSEIAQQHVGPGESLLTLPLGTFEAGGPPAVQRTIGTPAHNGHCKVIHKSTGKVVERIIADPELYKHPDGHHVVLEE